MLVVFVTDNFPPFSSLCAKLHSQAAGCSLITSYLTLGKKVNYQISQNVLIPLRSCLTRLFPFFMHHFSLHSLPLFPLHLKQWTACGKSHSAVWARAAQLQHCAHTEVHVIIKHMCATLRSVFNVDQTVIGSNSCGHTLPKGTTLRDYNIVLSVEFVEVWQRDECHAPWPRFIQNKPSCLCVHS